MWALEFLIQSFTQVGMCIYYPFTLLPQYLIAIHNYLHLYFVKQTWRLWLMFLFCFLFKRFTTAILMLKTFFFYKKAEWFQQKTPLFKSQQKQTCSKRQHTETLLPKDTVTTELATTKGPHTTCSFKIICPCSKKKGVTYILLINSTGTLLIHNISKGFGYCKLIVNCVVGIQDTCGT